MFVSAKTSLGSCSDRSSLYLFSGRNSIDPGVWSRLPARGRAGPSENNNRHNNGITAAAGFPLMSDQLELIHGRDSHFEVSDGGDPHMLCVDHIVSHEKECHATLSESDDITNWKRR